MSGREPPEYTVRKRAGLDPYTYADSDVLRNKFGIRDGKQLLRRERTITRERIAELIHLPITPKGFDRAHKHLFQDIYEWAGMRRTVPLYKGTEQGPPVVFAPASYIHTGMSKEFGKIAEQMHLKGISRTEFSRGAAPFIGEINVIHPFREGNGRTMRYFLRELARQAGHSLDLTRIDPQQWNEASRQADINLNYEPMEAVVAGAIRW